MKALIKTIAMVCVATCLTQLILLAYFVYQGDARHLSGDQGGSRWSTESIFPVNNCDKSCRRARTANNPISTRFLESPATGKVSISTCDCGANGNSRRTFRDAGEFENRKGAVRRTKRIV